MATTKNSKATKSAKPAATTEDKDAPTSKGAEKDGAAPAVGNLPRRAAADKQAQNKAAKAAGLTDAERTSLDPQARAPQGLSPDDAPANLGSLTEEDVQMAKGAQAVTLTSYMIQIVPDPMNKIGKRVFEHEIPILQELHGEDKIEIDEESARDEQVTISAQQEWDRLLRAYGPKGADALQKVYNLNDLAHDMGLPAPKRVGALGRTRVLAGSSAQRGAGV